MIQIWQFVAKKGHAGDGEGDEGSGRKVHFSLGEASITQQDPDDEELNKRYSHAIDSSQHLDLIHDAGTWDCVWKCK
jgi:hypothetical protein